MSWSLRIPAVLAAAVLAACQELPTSTGHIRTLPAGPRLALNHTPDIATINSVSCAIPDPPFPDVACSFSITNPQQVDLYLHIAAILHYTYECYNEKTGRVTSTVTVNDPFWTDREQTLSPGSNSENGWHLSTTPQLPENSLTGKDRKNNACKGRESVRFSDARIDYWYVGVYELEELDGDYTCHASDNRYNSDCTTPGAD